MASIEVEHLWKKYSLESRSPLHPQALALTGVSLFNEAGEKTDLFQTGDRLVIQIEYFARLPVRNPVFAFGIEDLNYVICYGTSSHSDGITIDAIEGVGAVRDVIDRLHLLTGSYKVTAAARQAGTNVAYDILLNAAFFQVRSDRADSGMLHLDHTWDLAKQPAVSDETRR